VKTGRFREDLYYRLNVAAIKIPPLRQRAEDIPLIIEHVLKNINKDLHKNISRVEKRALARIISHSWPGNVRELENILTRSAMYTQGDTILDRVVAPLMEKTGMPSAVRESEGAKEKETLMQEAERDTILRVLEETRWHYGNTCKTLGISRPTLNKKMGQYRIPLKPHG